MFARFAFLKWPLRSLKSHVQGVPETSELADHLSKANYSVRLLRYWWAGQALAQEARRLGRPLRVVDLGCERGWLKHFTPPEAVAHWTGVDWNPRAEARAVAGYDELIHANFDAALPLPAHTADALVSLHVFEHLPRPGATLAEVSRVLKPGGIFLGGAPTMPGMLARWRERYLRGKLRRGEVAPGGHITCLSPGRWRTLASEVGLETEFAVGSHAVRMTGSWLENFRLWVRLNQLWGALFPSLGSECYLRARREPTWDFEAQPLPVGDGRPRLLWATAACAALALLVGLGLSGARALAESPSEASIDRWLSAHQQGGDHFIVVLDDDIPARIAKRPDVTTVAGLDGLAAELRRNNGAHVVIERSHLPDIKNTDWADQLTVDSRLAGAGRDFYLLRFKSTLGTSLRHYLNGR